VRAREGDRADRETGQRGQDRDTDGEGFIGRETGHRGVVAAIAAAAVA